MACSVPQVPLDALEWCRVAMPGTYRSIDEFSKWLGRSLKRYGTSLDSVARVVKNHMRRAAFELMSGPHSLEDLRRAGHPYARRHAGNRALRARFPLLPINVQSGILRGSLQVELRRLPRARQITVSISAPYDKYLLFGTSKMVSRPLRMAMLARAHAVAAEVNKVNPLE